MSVMAATGNPYHSVFCQLINFCAVPRTNFIAAPITAPSGSFSLRFAESAKAIMPHLHLLPPLSQQQSVHSRT